MERKKKMEWWIHVWKDGQKESETIRGRFQGWGDDEELQSFMSQHRKSSVRGKVIDKK